MGEDGEELAQQMLAVSDEAGGLGATALKMALPSLKMALPSLKMALPSLKMALPYAQRLMGLVGGSGKDVGESPGLQIAQQLVCLFGGEGEGTEDPNQNEKVVEEKEIENAGKEHELMKEPRDAPRMFFRGGRRS